MRIAFLTWLMSVATASAQGIFTYVGICEPSGGVFLDDAMFAVASDESNVIRIYKLGSPDVVASVDLTSFLGYDKSDLEAATMGDGVIYWTASQSLSSGGKDKKRKVVFATTVSMADGNATLEQTGIVREDLKPALVAQSGSTPEAINVEGLATTANGGLYFGLRNLVDGKVPIVHLRNAAAVLSDKGTAPEFEETAFLDLGGRGVRSLERIGDRYLIVAGPTGSDESLGFAFYWWVGNPQSLPVIWETQPDLSDLAPEAVMLSPDGTTILIVSDDGDVCPSADLEDPSSSARHFRSIELPI